MDVLRGRVSVQRFQDKVVLIGAYAPSLGDWGNVSGGGVTEFEIVFPKSQLVFDIISA
ncbi:MAG: hypothetical protein RIE73_34700 [Coleofasciculus sp. C1-SOL-03]|uniref:hypothetical protein n=1 Tax=Coleofasciculus sp. C1-SOL-03 TaxID=3069522 RepID=UPI0033041A12